MTTAHTAKRDWTDRLTGCYLGKSIGGTLGMPYEGHEGFLNLTYYDPVPQCPLPNDDLDLQIVWLDAVKRHGLKTNRHTLAPCWVNHVDEHSDEYGVAIWNIKRGLEPPLTGIHNNAFIHGMGAAIRSEIWASLFPGRPRTAAYFALEDAVVDHDGEGGYAEVFLAAAESALYADPDSRRAIETGLTFLPDTSILKAAVESVRHHRDEGVPYEKARSRIFRDFGSPNFTDCVMNVALVMLGVLYGDDDFERTLLGAVNCGQDADCTGATAGAWMGIRLGAGGIPARWRNPVGDALVLSPSIRDTPCPRNVGELVGEIEARHADFAGRDLPEIQPPVAWDRPADFSDDLPWTANGRPFRARGIRLEPDKDAGPMIVFETNVKSARAQPASLMICGKGFFRAAFDGKTLGVWGVQSEPVPAPHRVRGGRRFEIQLRNDRPQTLRIERSFEDGDTDLWVAFTEPRPCRYLTDLEYSV